MSERLNDCSERMEKSLGNLKEELNTVRAGRANPHVLDHVMVDYYGAPTPVLQVANVTVPEARMIQIQPWEPNILKDIEKAIMISDVGINPTNDGKVIRLVFPDLTEDRRKELVKQCNKIGEKTKVEVRNARGDVKEKLKKAIKDGLSEDNEKDAEAELQKIHDKYIKRVDDLLALKTKEIMTV